MKILKFILPVLSFILMAAHFSRASNDWLALACLLMPLLLFSKKRWVMRIFQWLLLVGGVIWIERMIFLVKLRQRMNMPWLRLAIILAVVGLFTALSALVFQRKKVKAIFDRGGETVRPQVAAFFLTAVLLSIVQWKVKVPVMLLMERFLPGSGWVEILLLAFYAGWVTEHILDPAKTAAVRNRIWLFFSVVFFTQLLLGIAGFEKLLMTGELHMPVPALIVAGPLFRGGGYFMLILFGATVLLAGPAWCSYLCYIGAWDNLAARSKKRPTDLPAWRHMVRVGILVLVIAAALLLRFIGVPSLVSTVLAAIFGVLGVGIMVFWSRKAGVMVHCTAHCPIGLVTNVLSRVSPFRFRIADSCDACGACQTVCRYEALKDENIKNRKPGLTCTLCGDCVTRCHAGSLQYGFPGLKPETARYVFMTLVIALHAVFIGVARL